VRIVKTGEPTKPYRIIAPGSRVREDSFGTDRFSASMNSKVGHFAYWNQQKTELFQNGNQEQYREMVKDRAP